jgi:hypothetical protein
MEMRQDLQPLFGSKPSSANQEIGMPPSKFPRGYWGSWLRLGGGEDVGGFSEGGQGRRIKGLLEDREKSVFNVYSRMEGTCHGNC